MTEETLIELLKTEYGIENAALEFLRETGGRVYAVKGEKKYLLKLIGKAFADNARRSVAVTRYLEQNGFPVPKTVLTGSGEAVAEVFAEDEDRLIMLQEYIEGDEPDLTVRAAEVGELVGRFHCLMEKYPGGTVTRDKYYFIDKYLEFLRRKNCPKLAAYEELGGRLWEKVKDLPQGNCHGDLHRGNLLENPDGKIYFIDFDTVSRAPMMFDISVMCDMTDYFRLKEEDIAVTRNVYRQFMSGYSQHRRPGPGEIQSFPYWVAVRHFQLQEVIMEIYGINCNDERFDDAQLDWLYGWLDRWQ